MALILKESRLPDPLKLTERIVQKAIYFYWPDGYTSFPNVNLFGWEMDLALVSSSMYLTEIEIKLTLSDWKRDCKKGKFLNPQHAPKMFKHIKYFYYAVPERLLPKTPDFVTAETGIITFNLEGKCRVERQPTARKNSEKINQRHMMRLYSKFYYRYSWWDFKWDPKQTHFVWSD